MNKKPDKLKKYKTFCTRTDRNFFFLILLLMKDAKLVLNGKTRTRFTFMKTFCEDFVTGVSHRMIWTVLKTDSGHVALLTDNFFLDYFILNCKLWDKFLFSTITLFLIISYILIFYRNFELIFEFMALKRFPICGRNVCFSFFLRNLKSNSDNFNQWK